MDPSGGDDKAVALGVTFSGWQLSMSSGPALPVVVSSFMS